MGVDSSLVVRGLMNRIRQLLKALGGLRRKPRRAIILGADSPEYKLYGRLESEGEYKVLFFINEEPWSHRTMLGHGQLRYPSELTALCQNHKIDAIFYCDEAKAKALPKLRCELIRREV